MRDLPKYLTPHPHLPKQASEFPTDELNEDIDMVYAVASLRDVKTDLNIKECSEAMKTVSERINVGYLFIR